MPSDATITAIKPTQRDPARATIRVGRKVVATLYQQHIVELDLYVGQPWDDALAQRVQAMAEYDQAMRKAMQRITRRAMSRFELDRKLRDQGCDAAVRERVLDRLAELNYLDDRAFGAMLIRDLLARKPAGPALLRQKLMQKGVPRDLIDGLITEALADVDQTEDAVTLLRKKLPSVRELDPVKRKRRLLGLLQRRGFDPDTVRRAMARLGDELEPEQ